MVADFQLALNGAVINCATADQVVEVIKKLQKAGILQNGKSNHEDLKESGQVLNARWTDSAVKHLFRIAKPKQAKLLDILIANARTNNQLASAIDSDGKGLGGTIAGVNHSVRKAKGPSGLIKTTWNKEGEKVYSLDEAFRNVATKVRKK